MRNTIKTIAAFLIVLNTASANAKGDSTTVGPFCRVVAQSSEDSYKLIYKGADKEDVTVTWKDINGYTVYTQRLKSTEGFVKQYDLSALPLGTYTIAVEAEDFNYTKEVELGGMSNFNFVLKGMEGRSVLMTGYQPEGKDMTLLILDQNKNLLYKEMITDTKMVQKKYNFEQTNATAVTFVMFHNGQVFKEQTFAVIE